MLLGICDLWWPWRAWSLLALLCPSLTLCPGQTGQDEAVALTPWKEEGPFSCQRDPPVPHPGSPHPGRVPVANARGWSDVSLFMEWEPGHGLASLAACWALLGTPLSVGGSLLGMGDSPSLCFWWPLVQEALPGTGQALLGTGSFPGHRGLS